MDVVRRVSIARSVFAVLTGLAAILALSLLADEVAYALGLFPRHRVIYDTGPYVVATAYRGAIGVIGCWLAARLAPGFPMRHALAVGLVGMIMSGAGLLAALTRDLGPAWYPLALLAITPPCAWLGGALQQRKSAS